VNHARKAIRHAVVDLLKAGNTLAGARVLDSAYKPRLAFPSLVVLTMGEDQQLLGDTGSFADRAVMRVMHLDVSAEVQQNTDPEDTRDDLLGQVEQLLANAAENGLLSGIKDIVPGGMRLDTYEEGGKPIVVGRQRYQITYLTTQADPASAV